MTHKKIHGCQCSASSEKDCDCVEAILEYRADCIKEVLTSLNVFKNTPESKQQHIKDTPKRIAKAWSEYTVNIGKTPPKPTVFQGSHDELVITAGIPFSSLCSHHFFPFSGTCHVAYLPNEFIIGLSKIPRIVKFYSKMPQVQEELVTEIADFLNENLKPKFIMVIMRAVHSCCRDRGIESNNEMITSAIRINGITQEVKNSLKSEALSLIGTPK